MIPILLTWGWFSHQYLCHGVGYDTNTFGMGWVGYDTNTFGMWWVGYDINTFGMWWVGYDTNTFGMWLQGVVYCKTQDKQSYPALYHGTAEY